MLKVKDYSIFEKGLCIRVNRGNLSYLVWYNNVLIFQSNFIRKNLFCNRGNILFIFMMIRLRLYGLVD